MTGLRVMVFDDDPAVSNWAGALLAKNAIDCITTCDFAEVSALSPCASINVFALDRIANGHDHLEEITRLKLKWCFSGFLVISSLGEKSEICEGLFRGADDYMRKPLHPDEFVARIMALGRRFGNVAQVQVTFGPLSISVETGSAKIDGRSTELTAGEQKILRILASRKNRVVLRDDILADVQLENNESSSNTVDSQISRIRKKLGAAEAHFEIRAMRGVGYIMAEK